MRLTFRSKLVAIVAVAATALLLLVVASSLIEQRVDDRLQSIQKHYVPRIGLRPQLESSFERISRALQDAATAGDTDLLAESREHLDALVAEIGGAGTAIPPEDAAQLRQAIEDYYGTAAEVTRRLIAGETGDAMVASVETMQAKQSAAHDLLGRITRFDEHALTEAFGSVARAQQTGARIRLIVILVCVFSTLGITIWIGRDLFRTLAELAAGFRRFGEGAFATTIPVVSQDELGDVAAQANQMAARLHQLGRERDRSDWIKNGQVGLVEELQGELTPAQVAGRATAFLARYLTASTAAIHYHDGSGVLGLLGGHGLLMPIAAAPVPDSSDDIEVTDRRVLVPLLHLGKVTGVLELIVEAPWSEQAAELVRSVRDRLTIAIEVARARAALEQKADELTRTNQYKSQFLANMSHELRTPLNAIIGFSELLYDRRVPSDGPQHQVFLGHIRDSGRHLLELINDILDLSKVEAGKLEFQPATVDLDRLIDEVLGVLGPTATAKQIQLDARIDAAVGPLLLDPGRLKQVLYNYLSNALKFTPPGGTVEIRATVEGSDQVRLEVSDTGIGISAEHLDKMFADFQQFGDAARRAGGTGLGLALTRRLVEAQGGRVGVRSVLGEGSVFHAVLPRRAVTGA